MFRLLRTLIDGGEPAAPDRQPVNAAAARPIPQIRLEPDGVRRTGDVDAVEAREGAKIGDLITDLAWRPVTQGLHQRLLERLVRAGTLTQSRSDVLGVRRWPTTDPSPGEEIRRRLQSCLVGGEQPSERTVALVSLLRATDGLVTVIQPGDAVARKALAVRAEALTKGDWAGAAVTAAIDEAHASGIG